MSQNGRIRVTFVAGLLLLALLVAGCATLPIQPVADTQSASDDGAAATGPSTETTTGTVPSESTAAEESATGETATAGTFPAPVLLPSDETFNGMPVGFTQEGFPYRGAPDAPVVMNEFSDFQCPFCARYFVQTEAALNEAFVQPGTLLVVFRDFPLVDLHPNAPAAHEAALCVADQGAALFWAMHDQLFRTQTVWSNMSDPSTEFANLAEEVGAEMTAFNNCVAGAEREADVQASVNEGFALGFGGTPTFLFFGAGVPNGFPLVGAQPFAVFAETIDAIAAGEVPPAAQQQAAQEQQAGIPDWASPEGNAVDPDNPGFTVFGDQTRGDADAPIVIFEFSDFQCPYCLQHHVETQPTLDEQYVDAGLVRFVFKHFPLPIHPQAPAAGVAAECASDQDAFWEMYDLLFANVDAWSITDPTPVLVDLAAQAGLDTDAFSACLEDPEVAARVIADQTDGGQYIQGTPTFIILWGEGGQIIPGALPVETFTQELDRILAEIGVEQ